MTVGVLILKSFLEYEPKIMILVTSIRSKVYVCFFETKTSLRNFRMFLVSVSKVTAQSETCLTSLRYGIDKRGSVRCWRNDSSSMSIGISSRTARNQKHP
jgi:hypothetical protein